MILLIFYCIILLVFLINFLKYNEKQKQFKILKMKPDGNCFFRAISAALNKGDQNFHLRYRNLLYKSFLKYPMKSEFMSDSEINFMRNIKYNGKWIDSQLAIYRLSDILERDILFIGYGKIYNRKKFKKKKPIYLLWHTNVHYDLYDIVKDSVYDKKLMCFI